MDNAIHLAAGLKLRNACDQLMTAQGQDEMPGNAKVTEGFNLPARYVIHTVGPNMYSGAYRSVTEAEQDLKNCYIACLEAVKDYDDIQNIAFCSISTGVYGFPIERASAIAIETIEGYLQTHEHNLRKVVIDVFSKEDLHVYRETAKNRKTWD